MKTHLLRQKLQMAISRLPKNDQAEIEIELNGDSITDFEFNFDFTTRVFICNIETSYED